MSRVTQTSLSAFIALDHACAAVTDAFPEAFGAYHVGSSAGGPDAHGGYRDVDVRMIFPDDEYDRLLDGRPDEFWSLLCWSISEHLERATGLPVDFQFQRQTQANAEYGGHFRNPLGNSTAPRLYAGGPPKIEGGAS